MKDEVVLIGDVGATGGKWAYLKGLQVRRLSTAGYHPLNSSVQVFDEMVGELRSHQLRPDTLYYYGTGVIDDGISTRLQRDLSSSLDCRRVQVYSDLWAAVHATSDGRPLIVCILGTGSNSCLIDGKEITDRIPSLGYPHGDEGGGWHIGRELVRAYYYRQMPEGLVQEMTDRLPSDLTGFLHIVKNHISPNTYLGSFATFAAERKAHPWIHERVAGCLEAFVSHHILPYQMILPVHAVGGIAYAFKDLLREVLGKHGLTLERVIPDPIDGLINYYRHEH